MSEERSPGREWVAIVLAVGLATGINVITTGILYDAIRDPSQGGISENATQILTTAFGGIIGVLGSYIGFKAGSKPSTTTGVASDGPDEIVEYDDGDGTDESAEERVHIDEIDEHE